MPQFEYLEHHPLMPCLLTFGLVLLALQGKWRAESSLVTLLNQGGVHGEEGVHFAGRVLGGGEQPFSRFALSWLWVGGG